MEKIALDRLMVQEDLKSFDKKFMIDVSSISGEQEDLKSFDKKFIKVDQATLFDIVIAANYLDIKGLMDLSCQTVTDIIKGKSVEEFQKTFNIANDFTPEEEIQRENRWVRVDVLARTLRDLFRLLDYNVDVFLICNLLYHSRTVKTICLSIVCNFWENNTSIYICVFHFAF